MNYEKYHGFQNFIMQCQESKRIFLNEYFKLIDKNIEADHKKDKNRPGAFDWHHIIPESMGGNDSPKVLLEFKDHVMAHYYLFKAFENQEMAYAFNMLINRIGSEKFESFDQDEREQFLKSIVEARELYGKHRSLMATEAFESNHPTRGKFGKDHHSYGTIAINNGIDMVKVTEEEFELNYKELGYERGFPQSIKDNMKGKKSGYIKLHKDEEETSVPESDLDVYLATGWKFGRNPKNATALVGKCRYATPDGQFYAMLSHDDPIIQELNLILHVTEGMRESARVSNKLASDANRGSTVYNNGTIQKRCKSHPGEGWMVGELPVSQEIKKKRADAASKACTGTIVYNDGIRNYRLKPDETPNPSWNKGMAPQKKRVASQLKGHVTYNDGLKNYKIPPDQVPEPHWIKGMKPRTSK